MVGKRVSVAVHAVSRGLRCQGPGSWLQRVGMDGVFELRETWRIAFRYCRGDSCLRTLRQQDGCVMFKACCLTALEAFVPLRHVRIYSF